MLNPGHPRPPRDKRRPWPLAVTARSPGMATNLTEGWFQNSWQDRLDQLLDLMADYDVLLLEAPVGFGKGRTVERWHHLLAGSSKLIWRIDCQSAASDGLAPQGFGIATPPGKLWHADPQTARSMVAGFGGAGDEGRVLILENLHDLEDRKSTRLNSSH